MKRIMNVLFVLAAILLVFSCASKPAEVAEAPAETKDVVAETKTEAPAEVAATETPAEEVIPYVEPVLPEGEIILLDNFEDGNYWSAICESFGDGDLSLVCDLSTDFGTDGENSLFCEFDGCVDESKKAGFLCGQPLETDWTGAKYIAIDVNNPNKFDLALVAVTQAGESWEAWNQTPAMVCPPGKHLVLFDISSYKNIDFIQRMIIYQFGPCPSGTFYFDNYRIIK